MLLDECNPHNKIALTTISRKQRELRGKEAEELRQATIDSYFEE